MRNTVYPDLRLPAKMNDVTEEGVAAVEELISIMRDEAMSLGCRSIRQSADQFRLWDTEVS